MQHILLKQDKAIKYCLEYLLDGNALAQQLLHALPFDKGKFFAVIGQTADKTKIYQFQSGYIFPPNPLENKEIHGKEYAVRKKMDSVCELAQYLEGILSKHRESACVFEELVQTKADTLNAKANIAYVEDEVYYFLKGSEFSLEKGMQFIHNF